MGFFILGKDFAMKTLVSTMFYPVALFLSEYIIRGSAMASLLDLTAYPTEYNNLALIIATVFGGVFIGAGCAFTFLGGGSTGGVDVISFIICKIIKRAKSSVVFFIIDATIIISGMFVIGSFVLTLLGILSAFVSALMIKRYL